MDDRSDVFAAYALLMAAILNRDIVGAMPPAAYRGMPDDIRNRLESSIYQAAFDALPEDIRREAQRLVDRDPDILDAREIHASH